MTASDSRRLVVHVVHRFDTGGLENGIVNLINHMPAERYRHAVLALTEITDFKQRIFPKDVLFHALGKLPGQGVWQYRRLHQLMREWQPAVVHTRNLGTLEYQVPAWAAGVPARVHGEHGRDVGDLDGSNRRYQWVRRAYRPFVQHYMALSVDLADYLRQCIDVPAARITQVYNGVDVQKFAPAADGKQSMPAGCPWAQADQAWVIGTVGRMAPVKNQVLLAQAFVRLLELAPHLCGAVRLMMVGEGPLRAQAQAILEQGGVARWAWLPGERTDVADYMRSLNCFVLPSLAEGISNTILEAMACALPVVATQVGGNADLVDNGASGLIAPSGDVDALATALLRLAQDPDRARAMGRAGRAIVERRFSMQAMVQAYHQLYDRLLGLPPLDQKGT
jgi:sugar transferase (PEP-CTERM/EpsH1 system associated)